VLGLASCLCVDLSTGPRRSPTIAGPIACDLIGAVLCTVSVNAVAESFFSSLKKEHVKKKIYRDRSIAHAAIAEYIEAFHNPTRRHSHLGGVSPATFEAAGSRR